MDLKDIAGNIEMGEDGIYHSKDTSTISYPDEWNEYCFQIEQDSFWFKHRNTIIIETVKLLCRGNTFFDIGGGNGYVAKGLEDAGIETVLVEPGVGALNAKKRGLNHVMCSTLEDAGFRPSSMSSAGLFDVVEHIPDDLAFLSQIHILLKPGGYVFITVPAFHFLWSNEDVHAGHCRRYTTKQLIAVLKKAGFTISYSTYFFSILPIPVFFFRSLPSRIGLRKKSGDPAKHKKEHSNKKGLVTSILDKIWNWEISRVKRGKTIPFGGSCFIVARKAQ
jgi:SAM-dependent methyltransferase